MKHVTKSAALQTTGPGLGRGCGFAGDCVHSSEIADSARQHPENLWAWSASLLGVMNIDVAGRLS